MSVGGANYPIHRALGCFALERGIERGRGEAAEENREDFRTTPKRTRLFLSFYERKESAERKTLIHQVYRETAFPSNEKIGERDKLRSLVFAFLSLFTRKEDRGEIGRK